METMVDKTKQCSESLQREEVHPSPAWLALALLFQSFSEAFIPHAANTVTAETVALQEVVFLYTVLAWIL